MLLFRVIFDLNSTVNIYCLLFWYQALYLGEKDEQFLLMSNLESGVKHTHVQTQSLTDRLKD